MIRIAALLALLLAGPVAAETWPALHDVTGVAGNDVLNLRAEPSARSAVVGTLSPVARGVEVTALSADGKWGRVLAGEGVGWAAMRFLVRQPGPDWTAGQAVLACYGTEPFWSADVDLPAGVIRYEDMGGSRAVLPVAWARPAAGVFGLLGLGLDEGGFATLQSGDCSDGMSDRIMGLSLVLFRPDGGAADGFVGLSGCCTLAR